MISFQTRFKIAMALTFFPCLLLYPLNYPVREMVTMATWLLPFPSIAGGICILLFPIMLNETYGYYFFNAICCIMTIILMWSVAKCRKLNEKTIDKLHYYARLCVILTIIIAAIQIITGPALWAWASISTSTIIGRGCGFRTEPSYLAGSFAIYLALLTARIANSYEHRASSSSSLVVEGVIVSLIFLAVTRSILVMVVVLCFLPVFIKNLRYLMLLIASVFAAFALFMERIGQSIIRSDNFAKTFTSSFSSWRSIPDVSIFANWSSFLLPTYPSEVREKITTSIISTFGIEEFWIKNTYSTFAASVVSFGLVATLAMFFVGLKGGSLCFSRPARIVGVWFMLYIAIWITTPKFEASGWIAFGVIVYVLRSGTLSEVQTGNKEL